MSSSALGRRGRLTLVLLAAMLPLAAFQAHELNASRHDRIRMAGDHAIDIARLTAERFNDTVAEARHVLDIMARSDGARLPEPGCSQALSDMMGSRRWADGLWVIDEKGKVACSTLPGAAGVDVTERAWYRAAQRQGGFNVSDLFISKLRHHPTVITSMIGQDPVTGAARTYAANIDLGWLRGLTRQRAIAESANILVIDSVGRIVAIFPEIQEEAGKALINDDLKRAVLASPSGVTESHDIAGNTKLYGYQRIEGADLHILVGYDRNEILEPIERFGRNSLLMFAGVGLLTGFLIWFTGHKVFAEPLDTMSRLLKATLDNMDQGLIVLDKDGRLPICNRRAAQLLDLPADMMASQPLCTDVLRYQAAQGEFANAPVEAMRLLKPDEELRHPTIYERTRPNGTILEVRTAPLPEGGVVRTYTDVTAWRRAELEIRRSEERYRLLAESVTDMIVRYSLDGRRLYTSPAVFRILGYRPEEIIGKTPFETAHPDDAEALRNLFAKLSEGFVERAEHLFRQRRKDGEWIWFEIKLQLVRGPDGMPREIIGIARDVTLRQQQADELKAAKAEAERANAAKSEFLAAMSHEIRTPLASIIGFTDLLLEEDSPPDIRNRQLGLIRDAGAALLALVNDILDFSRIEAGRLSLSPEPFRLRDVPASVISMLERRARDKGIGLSMEIAEEVPSHIVGDEARLRQVLLNLATNAVKFTAKGRVSIHVSAPASSGRLRFTVTDTGIGIAPEHHHRLFQRFTQADERISSLYGGTGLGLAICKALTELMGGAIDFDSEVGRGSTFWFDIPLVAAKPETVLSGDQAPLPPMSARILIVDDVESNLEIAEAILSRAGYETHTAISAETAVAAMQHARFDLVLMDIQMPGTDGLAAARLIRDLPHPANATPIVAMTANVFADQIHAFRQGGMKGHVAKPFQKTQLLKAVAEAIEGRKVQADEGHTSADIFDEAAFAEIVETVGWDKTLRYLIGLRDELAAELNRGDRHDAAAQVHRLVSNAGFLGFTALSKLCAQLEHALATSDDYADYLAALGPAAQRTIAEIDAIMARHKDESSACAA